MQNRFPVWKNVLIIVVFLIAALYALPNFFGADPSVQISPLRNSKINQATVGEIENLLTNAGISFKKGALENNRVLVRLTILKISSKLPTCCGRNWKKAIQLP